MWNSRNSITMSPPTKVTSRSLVPGPSASNGSPVLNLCPVTALPRRITSTPAGVASPSTRRNSSKRFGSPPKASLITRSRYSRCVSGSSVSLLSVSWDVMSSLRPGWHHSAYTGVGDRLAHVIVHVSNQLQQNGPLRNAPAVQHGLARQLLSPHSANRLPNVLS